MEENDVMEGKKLEIAMFEQKVLEAIEIAEKQKKDSGVISNGELQFEIQIVKEGKKIKVHAFGEEILTLEDEKFNYNIEGLKSIQEKLADNPEFDYKQFGLPDIEYLEELEKQKEEQQREGNEGEERGESIEKGEEDKPEIEKLEREEPKKENKVEEFNPKSKDVQEMELGREFTDTDNLRKYIKDVFKEDCDKLYRVKTGSHDFKYMAEQDGKYKELDLSTRFEGRNTTQEIYILNEDGNFKREEVDSLLLSRDGRRGLATKIPDAGSTDVTKSFVVREINGKYVATQLIEKSGQNRDPKLPGADRFDRARGTEELREDIENMEEMENKDLDFADDGISVQEITLYEHFEKLGYKEEEIDILIKYMQDDKKTVEQAEEFGKRAKEIEKERPNEMPGSNWRAAKIEIEGNKYERPEGGNTPDQNPRKRGME